MARRAPTPTAIGDAVKNLYAIVCTPGRHAIFCTPCYVFVTPQVRSINVWTRFRLPHNVTPASDATADDFQLEEKGTIWSTTN
jgi:hypothetical protein